MIVGYHIIPSAYGFWLPNDPRGSWSDFVGSYELAVFGKATKTSSVVSVANTPHDVAKRRAAKNALRFPPVRFKGVQARAIGRGFAKYARRAGLTILACAIMPNHIHLVVEKSRLSVEQVAVQLKGYATRQLEEEGLHPFDSYRSQSGAVPKCFARGEWKVFLSPDEIDRAVRYVEQNPLKAGLPAQHWKFVTPFC